jgi:hypothetical protein
MRVRSEKERASARARVKKWRAENPELAKAARKKSYAANKESASAYHRRYRAKNRARLAANNKRWRQANVAHLREKSRAWRKANPELVKKYGWRTRGLPEPTRPQPPTCEICSRPEIRAQSLSLDHCHKTGKFRGWLCSNCNTGLGKFDDNVTGLRRAVAYLLTNG